jgi:hypothetical protein
MVTVTCAFVFATLLFFCFERTRWMGIVAAFVLFCTAPLVLAGLLVLMAIACYFIFIKRRCPLLREFLLRRD